MKTAILLAVIVACLTGCFSPMAYDRNQAVAVRALSRSGVSGIGVDVLSFGSVMRKSGISGIGLQTLAAVGDAALIYGAYEGLSSLESSINDKSDNGMSVDVGGSGNDIQIITINGDENDSNGDREANGDER